MRNVSIKYHIMANDRDKHVINLISRHWFTLRFPLSTWRDWFSNIIFFVSCFSEQKQLFVVKVVLHFSFNRSSSSKNKTTTTTPTKTYRFGFGVQPLRRFFSCLTQERFTLILSWLHFLKMVLEIDAKRFKMDLLQQLLYNCISVRLSFTGQRFWG